MNIRIRGWHTGQKKMFSPEELASDQLTLLPTGEFININSTSTRLSTIYPVEKFVPLLSTGLHDKNGKEIFEGDIFKTGNIIGEVFYDKRYACFGLQMSGGVHALVFGDSDHEPCIDDDQLRGEVLGNIYEHPDLLPHNKKD